MKIFGIEFKTKKKFNVKKALNEGEYLKALKYIIVNKKINSRDAVKLLKTKYKNHPTVKARMKYDKEALDSK